MMIRFAMPLLILTACAANTALPQKGANSDAARIAKRLAGLSPGAPIDCLPPQRTDQMQGYANTILYIGGRNKVWRTDLIGSCPGLSRGDLPVVTSTTGRVCRGDIVQTRARVGGMWTGSCALGPFVPYSK